MGMKFEVMMFGDKKHELGTMMKGLSPERREEFLETHQFELEAQYGMSIDEIEILSY